MRSFESRILASASAPICDRAYSRCSCKVSLTRLGREVAWGSDSPSCVALLSFTAARCRCRATGPEMAARSPCVCRVSFPSEGGQAHSIAGAASATS